jgi:hypothetical protein
VPADAKPAHRPRIEVGDQFGDRPVASEKNLRFRSRANIQRSTTRTATSTFALSRGFLVRVGRIAVR